MREISSIIAIMHLGVIQRIGDRQRGWVLTLSLRNFKTACSRDITGHGSTHELVGSGRCFICWSTPWASTITCDCGARPMSTSSKSLMRKALSKSSSLLILESIVFQSRETSRTPLMSMGSTARLESELSSHTKLPEMHSRGLIYIPRLGVLPIVLYLWVRRRWSWVEGGDELFGGRCRNSISA